MDPRRTRAAEPPSERKLHWKILFASSSGSRYAGSGWAVPNLSYTKHEPAVKLGPIELPAQAKQTVNVPMWAGITVIVFGGLMLVLGGKQ